MYRVHHPDDPGMHNMAAASSDSHTRVTYQEKPGIIQRIQSSFAATLFGIGLVVIAFPVLYWNEGRAVQTALSLDEGLKSVVPLHSIHEIQRQNQDKLVHLIGKLKTDQALSDPAYGVAVKAVKLKREVEMYQWVEHSSTREYDEGDRKRVETSYSYSQEWVSHIVNSHQFDNPSGHPNPSSMAVSSYTKEADPVNVGAFKLSRGLIGKIDGYQPIHASEVPSGKDITIADGTFYHSQHSAYTPTVGDLRVRFSYAGLSGKEGARLGDPMKVSIVARQHGSSLTYFRTESGDTLELLYPGEMTAKEIFEAEHSANATLTWVLRVVGWFLMFIGFNLMTSILTTLVSWLPIIRELVGLGVFLICLCLATSFSLVTIAIGWIAHRPLLGMALLAAAAVPFIISRQQKKKRKESKY